MNIITPPLLDENSGISSERADVRFHLLPCGWIFPGRFKISFSSLPLWLNLLFQVVSKY